ncbi:hypothetical protein C1646_772073 [Rhizophagus diaphanus]|nr:hypothetical protein C1646_772073 [Rhizophagus diaphanus] [Rhizophagus sp. MUCL 43196]
MSNKLNELYELNELEEIEIPEDLLTDNEQFSDEFFGENKVENQEKLYQVAPEMAFTNWKNLDKWLDKHGLVQGFAFTITHKAHINEERDRGHHSGDCNFYINAYRRKRDNLIYITKINGEYNHLLMKNINMVVSHYRKLTPKMRDDVKLLATCGVRAGTIIEVLQVKYPDNSDAGSIYLELMKQQQENPTFHVDACCFEDNHNRFHLAATAIISDEIKETFSWLFSIISKATNELIPKLLYIDTDLAMYDDVTNYLQCHLYKCREAWALYFTHHAFNAEMQNTQHIKLYNGIIKNNVNRSSFFMELERTIERLFIKESRYTQLNDIIGKLPLQRYEMNRSMHYRCCITNLENELEKQFTAEIPNGIFSEDIFYACVIELK